MDVDLVEAPRWEDMPNGDEGEGREETWAISSFRLDVRKRESSCVAV